MASCFFLIRSSVDRDKITKTVTFSTLGDFGFSMSPRDMYYRFYKISPVDSDQVLGGKINSAQLALASMAAFQD